MSVDPWDMKKGDERIEDSITTYIIFCEDENDEPIYFRSFEIEKRVKINAISNQKSAKLNLLNTIQKCTDDGLMECVNHTYSLKTGTTENIWCVYDRDLENTNIALVLPSHDINFTTSIQAAIAAGLKVAWSNDAFELWVLLHFEKIPAGTRLHREYIYERLTEIFKTVVPRTVDLDAITNRPLFNYKHAMKKKANFLLHVLPNLKGKESVAIENARELEALYGPGTFFHLCNPGTKIHHLVEELLGFVV